MRKRQALAPETAVQETGAGIATDDYRALVESAVDAVVTADAEGTITAWNPAAERLFGYAAADAVGQPLTMLMPKRYRLGHRQGMENLRLTGAGDLVGRTFVIPALRRDGVEFPVELSLSSYRGDRGEQFLAVIRPKADRRSTVRDPGALAENGALRRVPAEFRNRALTAMLEAAPDATLIVGADGSIYAMNRSAETLFGYPRDELIGSPVDVLVPERLRQGHSSLRRGYFTAPRARPIDSGRELYALRKDGGEIPVEISLSPLELGGQTVVSTAIRDLSGRKRFEEDLRQKNVQLERANAAKNKFLANMSHELRTPLNAIIGFTGILMMQLSGPLNEEQQKQLATVESSARHLLSLINDLLDLAKIEVGRIELHREKIACDALIGEVVSSLLPLAEQKGLRLDVGAEPGLEIVTDRRAFNQIVINLASNAIKFTDQGTVTIACCRRRTDAGDRIEVGISDTGRGISPEEQERLFEAFSQLQSRGEGTGLGLYLSRALASLLGGEITVRSESNQGSTFTLSLPER